MLDLTMASIIPLLTAAVTGAIFSALFLGEGIEFYFTLKDPFDYGAIPFYILLGVFTGAVSLYFTWMNGRVEAGMKKISQPFKRAVLGGSILGVLVFLFPPLFGEAIIPCAACSRANPKTCWQKARLATW